MIIDPVTLVALRKSAVASRNLISRMTEAGNLQPICMLSKMLY